MFGMKKMHNKAIMDMREYYDKILKDCEEYCEEICDEHRKRIKEIFDEHRNGYIVKRTDIIQDPNRSLTFDELADKGDDINNHKKL